MNKIIKDTLRLVAITLIAGVMLSFVYQLTKSTIEKAEADELLKSYRDAFSDADDFVSIENFSELALSCEELSRSGVDLNSALFAKSGSGETLGCVLSLTSHEGYGSDIVLTMGISCDGVITGVKVTSMSETPSLGANCQSDEWISQFAGISSNVEYTKTGKTAPNQIDAISGATYTTAAVTSAVNSGLEFAKICLGFGALEEGAD